MRVAGKTHCQDMTRAGRQVGSVVLLDDAEMLAKRSADPKREQRSAIFLALRVPNEQVTRREVDVLHANSAHSSSRRPAP